MVTLFLPEGYEEKADGSLPSVLYLHDMSYSFGYAKKTYPGFSLSPMIESLVQSGFAVVTFDLPGFGSRHRELQNFYRRYPNWSLMGKMVTETQEVLSYMQQLAPLDPQNIHLLGNGLGATVATLSELQQFPLKHILLIDPYHQYYKAPSCFEGLSFLAQHHGLLPRIGLFERHEAALPFSFAEVLQGIRSPVTVGFSTASRHNDWEYLQALQQKTAAMENVQFKALEHDQGIRSSDFSWIIDQLQTEE